MKRFVVIFLIIIVLNVECSSGGYRKRRPISEEDTNEDTNEDKNEESNEDSACLDSIEDHKCGKNEKWYSAKSPCPKLCKSIEKECKRRRKPTPGCDCKPGFSRKKEGGPCIRNENCPKKCPKNSHWGCGNACSDSCRKELKDCSPVCTDRCICDDEYRLIDGKCKPKSKCDEEDIEDEEDSDHDIGRPCGKNKVITSCGNSCQQSCPNLHKVCPYYCQMGCFCKPGYYEIDGECQPEKNCNSTCKENEVYLACGSSCQDKCNQKAICKDCRKGCFCKSGFKRLTPEEDCVDESQCPPPEESEENKTIL